MQPPGSQCTWPPFPAFPSLVTMTSAHSAPQLSLAHTLTLPSGRSTLPSRSAVAAAAAAADGDSNTTVSCFLCVWCVLLTHRTRGAASTARRRPPALAAAARASERLTGQGAAPAPHMVTVRGVRRLSDSTAGSLPAVTRCVDAVPSGSVTQASACCASPPLTCLSPPASMGHWQCGPDGADSDRPSVTCYCDSCTGAAGAVCFCCSP